LAGVPQEGWPALIWQPLLLARLGSLIIIILITSLVYLALNRQSQLTAAVEQRTQELSAINSQLEQRVEERTLELTMLLNTSRSIASTLELEELLKQVLDKLLPVVDYTGGAILILEDDHLAIWAYQGLFPRELVQYGNYPADNIIGRQLIEEQQPVLIPDVASDSPFALALRQAIGLTGPQVRYIRSWMGIPLIAKDRVIGMLALHHREPGIYGQQTADLTMAFANHVAVAIENAQLLKQARRLAVLQERQRLARELHDSVSQALYGISLGSHTAQKLLDRTPVDSDAKAALKEPLDYILSLSEGGLAEMRALIFELHPESLESEGLVAALAKQATALQTRHQIAVKTQFGKEPVASLPIKEVVYRVSQEGLNNVVKHASATKIVVSLSNEDDQLVLEISDNGKGFDLNADFTGHLGLRSMRERLERVGGTFDITSSPCHGTVITAIVPLN
jgi:signal transduction histidine kinase